MSSLVRVGNAGDLEGVIGLAVDRGGMTGERTGGKEVAGWRKRSTEHRHTSGTHTRPGLGEGRRQWAAPEPHTTAIPNPDTTSTNLMSGLPPKKT